MKIMVRTHPSFGQVYVCQDFKNNIMKIMVRTPPSFGLVCVCQDFKNNIK